MGARTPAADSEGERGEYRPRWPDLRGRGVQTPAANSEGERGEYRPRRPDMRGREVPLNATMASSAVFWG